MEGFPGFPTADHICDPEYFTYLEKKIKKLEGAPQHELIEEKINDKAFDTIRITFEGSKDGIKRIASDLSIKNKDEEKSLEEKVSDIWRCAKKNDFNRQVELIAFAYYMQYLFFFLSNQFGGKTANNHFRLANVVSDFLAADEKAEVLVLDFNYDSLMDIALESLFKDPNKKKRIYHSKVHGSCQNHWIREKEILQAQEGSQRCLLKLGDIDNWAKHDFLGFFTKDSDEYDWKTLLGMNAEREKALRPALILPFYLKDEYGFPCYERDSERIESHLRKTDAILVIGWSAKDSALIGLMQDYVQKGGVLLSVVAEDEHETERIRGYLSKAVPFCDSTDFDCAEFSKFLLKKKCKSFFGSSHALPTKIAA